MIIKIVTSVTSIAIAITDNSQIQSKILCLSIVCPCLLCRSLSQYLTTISASGQLKCLNIYSLAEDSFLFSYLFASKDNSQLSIVCIDATRETDLVVTSERTDNVKRYVEAIHCVCLVVCCVCHVYIISSFHPKVNNKIHEFQKIFKSISH